MKRVSRIVCALSFLWLMSIAGRSDLGLSTLKETIIQGAPCIAVFCASLHLSAER